MASITAWASTWPGPSCASGCRSYCGVSRGWHWRCPPRKCRCWTTRFSTECESSPLPGDVVEIELPGPPSAFIACRAVLFDLDGTLVDSRACVEKTWRTWCDRHGLDGDLVLQLSPGRQQYATVAMAAPHLDPD